MNQKKPILCLDFDGVCHSYTSGWKGADVIPDPPVPGLFDFLLEAEEQFEIHIFSTRSLQDGGIEAMVQWFDEWRQKLDKPPLKGLHFPVEKPPALVTLDDRAITFNGTWPSPQNLLTFQPWYKRHPVIAFQNPAVQVREGPWTIVSCVHNGKVTSVSSTFTYSLNTGLMLVLCLDCAAKLSTDGAGEDRLFITARTLLDFYDEHGPDKFGVRFHTLNILDACRQIIGEGEGNPHPWPEN